MKLFFWSALAVVLLVLAYISPTRTDTVCDARHMVVKAATATVPPLPVVTEWMFMAALHAVWPDSPNSPRCGNAARASTTRTG